MPLGFIRDISVGADSFGARLMTALLLSAAERSDSALPNTPHMDRTAYGSAGKFQQSHGPLVCSNVSHVLFVSVFPAVLEAPDFPFQQINLNSKCILHARYFSVANMYSIPGNVR